MKKIIFFFMVILAMGSYFAYAQDTDDQIQNYLNDLEVQEINKDDLKFKQFDSCKQLEDVFKDLVKDYGYGRGLMYHTDSVSIDMEMDETAVAKRSVENVSMAGGMGGGNGSIDYSQTNIQKVGVDEPEIIKTNGEYIYYYNSKEHRIYIIKSPLNGNTIQIDNAQIEKEINIPKSINGINIFVYEDNLVIIGNRYSRSFQNNMERDVWYPFTYGQKTSVIMFDTSDIKNLKLIKFYDVDGYFQDARLIDSKVYLLSRVNPNRWYSHSDMEIDDIDFTEKDLPKALNIDIDDNKLSNFDILRSDCSNISYILPTEDSLSELGIYPTMTLISVLDIDDTSRPAKMHALFSPAEQIHVSQNSLYILSTIRFPSPYRCTWGSFCVMPMLDQGSQTLVHKFEIDGFNLNYQDTNLVPGSPLTQYSMDEDKDGSFRILTRRGWNEGTNFFVLDKSLNLEGKIMGIQKDEQFKSSRYIGDKLYLVTFEQTDPLFVIDIADKSNPEIIGELQMPGYSTYLHPMGAEENGLQYLIGLGYDTTTNQWGGTQNAGLKVNMYKVDYNKKETIEDKCGWFLAKSSGDPETNKEAYDGCVKTFDADNINASVVDEIILGGKGSYSEALNNPRLFVMDKNDNVTLPFVLQEEVKDGERCSVYTDGNGAEIKSDCYPIIRYETTFAGLKSFSMDKSKGIDEIYSVDYMEVYKKLLDKGNDRYPYYDGYEEEDEFPSWMARSSNMRVGYIGDSLYMLNNYFANFFIKNNISDNKYLYFTE